MEFGVLRKTLDTKVEIRHVYLGWYYSLFMTPEDSSEWWCCRWRGCLEQLLSFICLHFTGGNKGNVFQTCRIIYRKDYAVKCKDECKELHRNRRKIFLIQLLLILLFFPFVPAIIYSQILWVWGIKNVSINTLEKRENLARQIRGDIYNTSPRQ